MTREEIKKLVESYYPDCTWMELMDGGEFLCDEDGMDVGITIGKDTIRFHEAEPAYVELSFDAEDDIVDQLEYFDKYQEVGREKFPTVEMPTFYATTEKVMAEFNKDLIGILDKYENSIVVCNLHTLGFPECEDED